MTLKQLFSSLHSLPSFPAYMYLSAAVLSVSNYHVCLSVTITVASLEDTRSLYSTTFVLVWYALLGCTHVSHELATASAARTCHTRLQPPQLHARVTRACNRRSCTHVSHALATASAARTCHTRLQPPQLHARVTRPCNRRSCTDVSCALGCMHISDISLILVQES
jgi:hypothetical protein